MTIFLSLLLFFSFNLCGSSDVKDQASDHIDLRELTSESAFRQISQTDYEAARRTQVSPTPASSPLGPQPQLGTEYHRRLDAISNLDINQFDVDNNTLDDDGIRCNNSQLADRQQASGKGSVDRSTKQQKHAESQVRSRLDSPRAHKSSLRTRLYVGGLLWEFYMALIN